MKRMICRSRSFVRLVLQVIVTFGMAGWVGCQKGITEPCWMGLDTLYVSDVDVRSPDEVKIVFERYLQHADSSGTGLPDGAISWAFERAELDREYGGTQYWRLWHYAQYSWNAEPLLRRKLDVDERGALVAPLGCM